ncbi:MAG TPA: class F sortase [Ktedonobacteraceae bacterium]|nr:class F sortase [Ktedonobacteraceae bacterium]
MKKLLLLLIIPMFIFVGVIFYNYNHNITGSTPADAPWSPAQLQIPAIHVDAPVMDVGRTASGAMDAPVSKAYNSPYWSNVFWYDAGAAPGQPGNAVIAGHVNRVGGDPAVFWSLSSLQPGDAVTIKTNDGTSINYVVNQVVRYPANYPGQEAINAVFGPTTGHHLNLITCSGVWTGSGYDERLVVFTTQVG